MPAGRILTISSDDEFQEYMDTALADTVHTVFQATDGAAALARLLWFQPDLIFLDLHNTLLDRWAFLYMCRRMLGYQVPIILVTPYHSLPIPPSWGIDAVLEKPIDLDTLYALVCDHLRCA